MCIWLTNAIHYEKITRHTMLFVSIKERSECAVCVHSWMPLRPSSFCKFEWSHGQDPRERNSITQNKLELQTWNIDIQKGMLIKLNTNSLIVAK